MFMSSATLNPKLQPWDVVCFGLLQKRYSEEVDKWIKAGNCGIDKGTFLKYVNQLYLFTNYLDLSLLQGGRPIPNLRSAHILKYLVLQFSSPLKYAPCNSRAVFHLERQTLQILSGSGTGAICLE
jgi:hypothetical protein